MVFGTLLGIVICACSGLFVGGMVTRFQLPPFIVTLGIMMMASGLSFRLAKGQSISELPEAYFWLGGGQTFGVPNPVWLMILLYVVAHIVMSRTVFGRYVLCDRWQCRGGSIIGRSCQANSLGGLYRVWIACRAWWSRTRLPARGGGPEVRADV